MWQAMREQTAWPRELLRRGHHPGWRNRTLHLLAVPAGNRTPVLANAETYLDERSIDQRYRARFGNVHRSLFGGLRDWGPCHLTKENFCRRNCVRVTATRRKDTEEDTLSHGRTRHSAQTRNAVDVKGSFLGTHS
ncbi:hypothetical protein EJ02DRAFT_63185 [Clathrospora elynae]|uniref:Uncharacterized protein n=1 Tax=Clathrospora elynae TaxID=706981 RepID=A0A6A5SCH7_9PLEO|nr:hypothetical protein EJ02DRAFT_63185 [Clathrospora elynae]